MDLNNNENLTMEEAMLDIDKSMKKIKTGDIVKGKVVSVLENEVIVNIGYMADGIIPVEELSFEDVVPSDVVKETEEIFVYILKRDDGEGNVLLSKKRADEIKLWNSLTELYNRKENVIFKVKEVVKGGLRGCVNGLKAFMPASLVSAEYTDDLNVYLEKELECRIDEISKKNQNIVVSRKVIELEELNKKKEILWNSIKKGQKVKGVVTKIMNFGAFVDLGGIEGLIHLSELAWRKVKNASEVVSIRQPVNVYVLDVDKDKKRIALSLKQLGENPWDNIEGRLIEGSVVEGVITRLLDFGAFVEIEEGIEGLVHVTEISDENIVKPSNMLTIGERVKVKILSIDKENHRLSLSIKEAKEKVVEDFSSYVDDEENTNSLGDLFKDKLKNLNLK
ncbi:30S ribosomal protein S1 [Hathewaya limosa]|uniref:Small subunit ribosomal protein S1 n=1 Tax=Hathewaya limosa TaxID=1536 RepID=A0ABU0JTM7_HATLI|nr:30S ribosomal protein S1 [Hathewaya limosa]MDQ0480457.1 small subunit ribosomal protein S1 [Hathewaya limosa]